MRSLLGIIFLTFAFASPASAVYVNGELYLRDAIYLYQQSINAKGSKTLVGVNCDVLQLVLDVESGYTDLAMGQSNYSATDALSSQTGYADRIQSTASMFAYAITSDKAYKTFQFRDAGNLSSSSVIGSGTAFAYCFSTTPGAYVYFQEQDICTRKLSNGSVSAISGCTPDNQPPSEPISDMSDLVGSYSQSTTVSISGTNCYAYNLLAGTSHVDFSVTLSGSTLTVLSYTQYDACTHTFTKTSGNSSTGYKLSGNSRCRSGLSAPASGNIKRSVNKLLGTVTGYFSGCTQTGQLY